MFYGVAEHVATPCDPSSVRSVGQDKRVYLEKDTLIKKRKSTTNTPTWITLNDGLQHFLGGVPNRSAPCPSLATASAARGPCTSAARVRISLAEPRRTT